MEFSEGTAGCDMNRDPLPHLQFAILSTLRGKSLAGREIREELRALGIPKAGPAFYRLMSRLEDAGYVEGWYEQEIVDSQIFREKAYKIRAAGIRAWDRTRAFHVAVIHRALPDDSPARA